MGPTRVSQQSARTPSIVRKPMSGHWGAHRVVKPRGRKSTPVDSRVHQKKAKARTATPTSIR